MSINPSLEASSAYDNNPLMSIRLAACGAGAGIGAGAGATASVAAAATAATVIDCCSVSPGTAPEGKTRGVESLLVCVSNSANPLASIPPSTALPIPLILETTELDNGDLALAAVFGIRCWCC